MLKEIRSLIADSFVTGAKSASVANQKARIVLADGITKLDEINHKLDAKARELNKIADQKLKALAREPETIKVTAEIAASDKDAFNAFMKEFEARNKVASAS